MEPWPWARIPETASHLWFPSRGTKNVPAEQAAAATH